MSVQDNFRDFVMICIIETNNKISFMPPTTLSMRKGE